jgi:hypothetical protein
MTVMTAADMITLREGYDALRVFLEKLLRRHGEADEEIELVVGALKWADGAPVDPTMWEDWLAAVQIVCSA